MLASPYIPIDISLGSDARECLVLALLALAPLIWRGPAKKRRECLMLCGGVLLLVLNPWCANFVATRTHAVMSWRWIWIAPVAVVTAALLAVFWSKRRAALPGIALTLLFLCAGAWTCRSGNMDFRFARPQWKLPGEYAEVRELAALLPSTNEGVMVLAPERQAAWLPVARPGLPLVMGGHTQKGSYARLVEPREYAARITAQSLVEGRAAGLPNDLRRQLLDVLRVTHIVLPRMRADDEPFASLRQSGNARLAGSTRHFVVLHLPRS